MITYHWTIAQLDRKADTGGIVTAHWRCTAQDGDYTASSYGTVGFTPNPEAPTFKPFDQLTKGDVLAWVWNGVDKDDIEARLANDIAAQQNPPVVSGLPWGAPE